MTDPETTESEMTEPGATEPGTTEPAAEAAAAEPGALEAVSPKGGPEPAPRGRDVSVGVVVVAANAGASVARLALLPARLVSRSRVVRRQVDRLADTGSEAAAQGRERVESAVAGSAADEAARVLVEHHVVERVLRQVLADPELQAAIVESFDQEATERLARQLIASPAFEKTLQSPEGQRLIAQAASSPGVRDALTSQTAGFVQDASETVRDRAAHADDAIERGARHALRRPAPGTQEASYAGLSSRAVAFVIDLLLALGIYLVGAGVVALVASLVGGLRPQWLAATLAAVGWLLVAGGYFAGFWSLAGQTPGMGLMRLRVDRADGRPLGFGRSLVRFVGVLLAIVPFFAGFLPVLFDRRRRGLADYIAGTVVVHADRSPVEAGPQLHADGVMRAAPTG